MGSCERFTTFDGELSRNEVTRRFQDLWDEEREYHGSDPYSGTFAAKDRTIHFRRKMFRSIQDAEAFILRVNDKWGPVTACHAEVEDDKTVWVVGGWCPE